MIDTRYAEKRGFCSEPTHYTFLHFHRSATSAAIWVNQMASRKSVELCTCCRSGTRSTTDCVRPGPVPPLFIFTANVSCLMSRRAAAAAPRAQTSEPLAGFRMGQWTYRTDAVAGRVSGDEVVVTSVLLPSHHASKADCQSLLCARGPRSGGTDDLSHPSVPLASPGTLGTAPGGPPGLRRGPDGRDDRHRAPCALAPD